MYKPKAASIFLNRACPRHCPYCNSVKPEIEKKRLSVEEWKNVFELLEGLGVEFFLILGTEPLLMGDEIVELVRFWSKKDYEYGFYSTSPEPWFSKLKDKLIEAGIRNWSSGIDYIDEVYRNGKWSSFTHELVKSQHDELIRKAREAVRGMKEMDKYVEETHAQITISKMNVEMVPGIVKWLSENIENIHVGLNFVEYSPENYMDFATSFNKAHSYFFTKDDIPLLKKLEEEINSLDNKYKARIQNPLDYLSNYDYIINLNRRCALKSLSMGIEADGTIRLCGYRQLKKKLTVKDLEENPEKVLSEIEKEHEECHGCYWSYPYTIEKGDIDIVNYRSELWKRRLEYNEVSI